MIVTIAITVITEIITIAKRVITVIITTAIIGCFNNIRFLLPMILKVIIGSLLYVKSMFSIQIERYIQLLSCVGSGIRIRNAAFEYLSDQILHRKFHHVIR